jgi:hypothetical protein
VKVEAWMPDLGLRSQTRSIATYIGHGNYRVDSLPFSRPGWWNVALEIDGRFGRDSVAFNIVIPAQPADTARRPSSPSSPSSPSRRAPSHRQ